MVMEGDSGEGALISMISPLSNTSLLVELPKTAIRVASWVNSGKFSKGFDS